MAPLSLLLAPRIPPPGQLCQWGPLQAALKVFEWMLNARNTFLKDSFSSHPSMHSMGKRFFLFLHSSYVHWQAPANEEDKRQGMD